MDSIAPIFVTSSFGFLLTYFAIPRITKALKRRGMVHVDLHKVEHSWIPGAGGWVIMLAYILSVSISLPFLSPAQEVWRYGYFLITIALIGMVGAFDEVRSLRHRYKVLLLALLAYPMVMVVNNTAVTFPYVGDLEFGWLYLIVLIPVGVTAASNLTNMLAGFNGLEAGIGSIACLTISAIAILKGRYDAAVVALPLAMVLLAFLWYNWYPAKIFPGDSGTLLIGTVIASASILSKMEFVCAVLLAPHIIDFILKFAVKKPFSGRQIYGDTKARKDGVLVPPPYPALAHLFLMTEPLNEEQLVKRMLLLEVAFAALAFALAILMY